MRQITWKYSVITLPHTTQPAEWDRLLNHWSLELGWELVTIVSVGEVARAIFKKKAKRGDK